MLVLVLMRVRVRGRKGRALRGRRVDHQRKALLGGRELGNVVVGMRAADVLLHRAIALFLRAIGSVWVLVGLCWCCELVCCAFLR
jgi:hypothetical protein